jgi:hypothetical protein
MKPETWRVYRDGCLVREYAAVDPADKARVRTIAASFERHKLRHPCSDWVLRLGRDKRSVLRPILQVNCLPTGPLRYRGSTSHIETKI